MHESVGGAVALEQVRESINSMIRIREQEPPVKVHDVLLKLSDEELISWLATRGDREARPLVRTQNPLENR